LVVTHLLEPADHAHGFVLADDVAGASDSVNSASLVRVVGKLMPSGTFAEDAKSSTWIRAFGGSSLLAHARDVHWRGVLHYEERVTPERSESRVLTFRARDPNKDMPRPFLGVQYMRGAQLAQRLAQLHAVGLIGMSPRAALTLVETARDAIVPRLPPAPPPQPPLAHAPGGLASLARTAVQTFEALPGSATHPFLSKVALRLATDAGREHYALVNATAGWLRAGAGEPTDERVCTWARSIFVQEAAAVLMQNPSVDLLAPSLTVPCPSPLAAASPLQPSPFSQAGATRATPRTARRSFGIMSAEEVTGMSAVELAAHGGELLEQLQLVSQEGIKRARLLAAAPDESAARPPLRVVGNAQR
jgi:hypothetical protein